jgi:aspartokinase
LLSASRTNHSELYSEYDADSSTNCRLGIVVSAMGGTPKTTDLLLNAVVAAAERHNDTVKTILQQIQLKHETCIKELFPDSDHWE